MVELYRDYGSTMVLRSADELAVHRDHETSVIVLEYAVHGHAVHTGRAYDNPFVSVITVKDRKVTHWRDYPRRGLQRDRMARTVTAVSRWLRVRGSRLRAVP
ncbi:nuclear transport factor 2 family protein [Streptomyces sp. LN590]|uniref:nuclear transport factor 2 family protein n=1 Tax=unclassified Streptomyces TaxID=2593676 RepID=UPI00371D9BAE